MELNKEELNMVLGGAISGAVITSVTRAISVIYEIGRGFGSSIKRFVSRQFC